MSLLLALVTLIGMMAVPVSAKTIVIDSVEYENDTMLKAYWAPHVAHKKNNKMLLSDDVPYASSKKSMSVSYDIERTGWGIWYFTIFEPDKVEYASHITFMAKAEKAMDLTIAVVQKDLGFGGNAGNSGAVAKLTTEWQRFTFPLAKFENSTGEKLLDSIQKELWISNISLGMSNTLDNFVPVGKYWIDDIAFVDEADIPNLPKVDSGSATTTKAPDATTTKAPDATTTKAPDATTTKAPDATTTKAPDATTTKAPDATTTKAPVSGNTTTKAPAGGDATTTTTGSAADGDVTDLDGDVTTTTGDSITAEPTGALKVLDAAIKLDGDKVIVPNGMTVSNVLSRLEAESGCELAIVKDDAALANGDKVATGMTVTVSSAGAVLKSYALEIETAADNKTEAPNNGWVLPVCIVVGVLVIAAVLLIVFRKKIFKK